MNTKSNDKTSTTQLPSRAEIADTFKWNLSDIYSSDETFQSALETFKGKLQALAEFKGSLAISAQNLAACLQKRDELSIEVSALFAYARMHRDIDAKESAYQAMTTKVEGLLTEYSSIASFIDPEILTLPKATLENFQHTEPALEIYKFYFADLYRQNSHVLSPTEEALIAQTGELRKAAVNIFTMLTNADIKFPETLTESGEKVTLSEGRYNALIRSKNPEVRKDAFKNLFTTYASYRNTLATSFDSNIKASMFYAKAKKYSSTLAASLDNTNVPTEVYTNLVDTIHKHFQPLHKYINLKKSMLKLNEIHMYDLYVSLAQTTPADIEYSEGLKLVLNALKPLGAAYLKDLETGANSSWIDIYENQGKRTGAYSWGVYGVHPFVLLNYDNKYSAVSTLAHELGHAMHSYYSNKYQEYINSSYTIFCAEVASTTNEILLLDYMLDIETNPQKRIFFINQYLEQVRTTVYRQALFAEFEMITHSKAEAGEALTADVLENIWLDLNRQYYGNELILDDEIKIEWARIPHFYRPFYVYQYVTGYAAATTLAQNLVTEGLPAQKRYLNYLQSGGSDYSINLLKNAGVDMSTPKPLEITLEKFSTRLFELETLLK